jgi:putative polyhydroxyalkanoate system protein
MWHLFMQNQVLPLVLVCVTGATGPIRDCPAPILPKSHETDPASASSGVAAGAAAEAGILAFSAITPGKPGQISVLRRHDLGAEGARQAAEQMLVEVRAAHGIRIDAEWRGPVLHARGNGFDGTVRVGGSDIEIQVRLGLLLSPLRGTIAREAEGLLDRHLGGEPGR